MIGGTRQGAERAAAIWEPLREVIGAVGSWVPSEDQFAIGRADASRRGRAPIGLAKPLEAGLLNGVLYASLLPDRSDLERGDVPYLVPVFVPVSYERRAATGARAAVEVLALSVSIDGVPLGELGALPVLRAGSTAPQAVTFTMASPKYKRLEDGTVTVFVGFGPVPLPVLSWRDANGALHTTTIDPGVPIPDGAPRWMRRLPLRSVVPTPSESELSVCYSTTSELGRRSTARLLAQFRPMVAGRMRHHAAADAENVKLGGTPCSDDDRRNDLYECLLLHVRSYVAKAVREDGAYARDLFAYVTGCFKPAATRAMLTYGPRTGHQDPTGASANVSELVGGLRQHAAIYRLTDPASARSHHAVNWILARRLRDRLTSGDLTIDDLWAMWQRGDMPAGVKVPDLASWEMAIGHQVRHVPFDHTGDGDDEPDRGEQNGVAPACLSGAPGRARAAASPAEDDLDLLTHPSADALRMSGFFAITSEVAARLAADEPEVWARAVGEGRAVTRLLREVMQPFAADATARQAAARLHDACTVGSQWLAGDELLRAWRAGGADADQTTGEGGSRSTSTLTDSSRVGPSV